jgi:myo-inositol 2-dehydrogenase/D-chiro-inositol 1-dehydrogenase
MELFGLRDSVAVGWDDRTPLRSLEPGIPPPGNAGYKDFLHRFEPAYRAELRAFLTALRDGTDSPCPATDARQAVAVSLAADRSMNEHRPVKVQEIG